MIQLLLVLLTAFGVDGYSNSRATALGRLETRGASLRAYAEPSGTSPVKQESTDTRELARLPNLAALGVKRETPEEYAARRAATAERFGTKKPESPAQFEARRRRRAKEAAERAARKERYEDLLRTGGPPGARQLEEVEVGDVFEGATLLEELSGAKAKRGAKAWFDVGVWRRRGRDTFPIRVSAMVRLYKEDALLLRYFRNDKRRAQRLWAVDVQKASGRLVASFTPPGVRRVGRRNAGAVGTPRNHPKGGLSADLAEEECLLEELKVGQALRGTVVEVGPHAAWLNVGVVRRSPRDGLLRTVNARLPARLLDPEVVLSSTVVRSESVERVITASTTGVECFVRAVYPESAKFDVALRPAREGEDDLQGEAKAERRREQRRRQRRRKVTAQLEQAALALAAPPAAAAAAGQAAAEQAQAGQAQAGAGAAPQPGVVPLERVAEVKEVRGYGLLVDVGALSPGLVHISDVARAEWTGKAEAGGNQVQYSDGAALVRDLAALVPVGQRLVVRLKPDATDAAAGAAVAGATRQGGKPEGKPRFAFAVVRWLGEAPVDPDYEPPAASSPTEQQEYEEFLPPEEEEEEEEEDFDDQDKWEDRFGMGDNEYY